MFIQLGLESFPRDSIHKSDFCVCRSLLQTPVYTQTHTFTKVLSHFLMQIAVYLIYKCTELQIISLFQ